MITLAHIITKQEQNFNDMEEMNEQKLIEECRTAVGKWKADVNMGGNFVLTIDLDIEEMDGTINGDLTFTPAGQQGKDFILMGTVKDGILLFVYFSEYTGRTSCGTVTLKLEKDGTVLDGVFAYYSQERDVVDSLRTTFHRV